MSRFDGVGKATADWVRRFQRAVDSFRLALRETSTDPNERRLSAETLGQFRLIVDSIPAPVAIMTPAGEVEVVNRPALEYFGTTLEALRSWFRADAVHPDDLLNTVTAWKKAVATGKRYEVESRHRRADGIYRWFHVHGFPLTDTEGGVVRWCVLQIDVDDLKQAEQALRTSEINFRSIIDTLPTTAWSTRPDGYCDFLNRRWLDYAGFTAERARGWGWSDVIHPDDAEGLARYWQSCLASGTSVDTEARMRRFDGAYRWFLFRANPLRDETGNIVKWYGTNTDIDDRKRAEEKLRRNEAFLAEGQRLSSSGSFSWRLDTDEITFSGELYRIYDFERDSPVTLTRIGGRVHPEDGPIWLETIERARDGKTEQDYEIRLVMPDDTVKCLHTISRGIRHQDGRLELIGAVQDVTQRRSSEEALAKAQSELAHVARVTSLGVLTASIAHEVNQPLASIVTNAETCLRWLARPEPNVQLVQQLATRVVADARRASEIIDRTRSMAARRTPQRTPLSLGEIVEESIVFLRHEFQSRNISVSVDLTPSLPRIVGDRTQLQQVIVNLVINAAQAVVQSEAIRRSIFVRTTQPAPETVCCSVEDSGPGIDPTHLPRLFDSFFTTKDTGMGMGLPICRSIIEAHEGYILADNNSALGGARFSFALPASFTN